MQDIGNREHHVADLSDADIARVADLDHGRGGVGIPEVAADGAYGGCVRITKDARACGDENRVRHDISSRREVDDLASSVLAQDSIDVRSVIRHTITVDRVSRNGLDVYDLVHPILLVGWRRHGEILPIGKEYRRSRSGHRLSRDILLVGIPGSVLDASVSQRSRSQRTKQQAATYQIPMHPSIRHVPAEHSVPVQGYRAPAVRHLNVLQDDRVARISGIVGADQGADAGAAGIDHRQ